MSASAAAFSGAELLRTRRLILRQLTFADAPDLRRLDSDERVTRYLLDDQVNSNDRAYALINYAQQVYHQHEGLGLWHARDTQHCFVGYFSLMPLVCEHEQSISPPAVDHTVDHLDEQTCEVEIGVRLRPHAWGRFYASEGGAALRDHAFGTLGLTRLVGICDPDNKVIPLLLKRIGFVVAGDTTHFDKPALRFEHTRERWLALARDK